MPGNEIESSAKAVQAVAEAGKEAIEAGRSVGAWAAHVFGYPIEQLSGLWGDRLQVRRATRWLDMSQRYERRRAELGISGPSRIVSPKFGMPLLEAAADEDDLDLRDMLATLLANVTRADGASNERRAFATTLREMEPLDARVLLAAYNSPSANVHLYPARTVYTAGLPDAFAVGDGSGRLVEPSKPVKLALWNLVRLGCIAPAGVWDGAVSIALVTVTELGLALIEASTLPEQRTYRPPSGPTPA